MRALPVLLGAWVLPGLASAADITGAPAPASLPGTLVSTAAPNFLVAPALVLFFVFGMYAYASLARFAPYHEWIYLYLVSLTGVVWALFLLNNGGSLPDAVFILTTVAGLNLIVHVLRFDRIALFTPKPRDQSVVSLFDV